MSKTINNIWFRRIFVCICSYLCILSFNKISSLHGDPYIYWGGQYFGYNLTAIVLFGICVWLFNRYIQMTDKRLKAVSVIGGILLSMSIVYGAYAHYVNDIFRSTGETFLQMGMVLAIGVLTVPLMAHMIMWIEKAGVWFVSGDKRTDRKEIAFITKMKVCFRKRPWTYFLFMWVTVFVCYLPVFLANWPGNFVFDAKYQLQNVNMDWYTTHHPLLHTLMMGKAYQFGESVGNVSFGYQFYTLAQMLILSSSFAYAMLYLYKRNVKTIVLTVCWIFFALFPMNAVFSISSTKDVLCAAFFLYFMIFLFRYLNDRHNFKVISYVGMILSGTLLALFRNNALYAVLVTAIIIIIMIKGMKEKGKLLLVFVAILALSKVIQFGLVSYTNAEDNDSYRETMCVPLQSLGRVACYRGEELDPALYEEICYYIPEITIPGYNPYNADGVKNSANERLLRDNTMNFFKLWIKVGLQYPDEYIEGLVTNTMGYWYPLNQGHYVSADIAIYHTLIGAGEEIEKVNLCPVVTPVYNWFFYELNYRNTPILGYLFRNAPYIWACITFMLYAVYKKDKKLIMLGLLPVIYVLTCMCGPMAALRYIYCIIVCMPLMICTLLASAQKKIE
ncbi:MAG: hypothetical protein IJZ42_07630 [Lachnospiraceae bacterium]|nr:hypothetical protein [Lachnospiraceae bacterium]